MKSYVITIFKIYLQVRGINRSRMHHDILLRIDTNSEGKISSFIFSAFQETGVYALQSKLANSNLIQHAISTSSEIIKRYVANVALRTYGKIDARYVIIV